MVSRRLLRIKILKALYGHFKSGDKTINASEKELFVSIEKTYDLYHFMMQLLVEVADYAQARIDIGKQKYLPTPEEKNPNTKFVDNKVVAILRSNEQLRKRLHQSSLTWDENPELIKKLYNNLLASKYYKKYMAEPSRSFDQDQSLAVEFFQNELEDFEDLYQILEDMSIHWIDDVEFELGMIIKTVKKFTEGQPTYISLMPLYKDEVDFQFTKRLFRKATVNHLEYRAIVDEYTANWDVERIAYMDILIMIEAIAEMIEFKEIPIKISMNEYIELSKFFSTPNSSTFVNGVLDKVVKHLTESGAIAKEGLGLVEPQGMPQEEE
jgi:Transcription termination factor